MALLLFVLRCLCRFREGSIGLRSRTRIRTREEELQLSEEEPRKGRRTKQGEVKRTEQNSGRLGVAGSGCKDEAR